MAHDTGDWRAAAELIDVGIDAISDFDTGEPPLILGMLLCLRGECDVFTGDSRSAIAHTEAGYEISSRYPDSWGRGFCAWSASTPAPGKPWAAL